MLALLLAAACAPDQVCEIPLALSPVAADALLGSRSEAWWISGDILTVVARREGQATLCCAMQRDLHPIGRGLQAVSVRVPDIGSAIFDVDVYPPDGMSDAPVWRGPSASPAPERSQPLAGKLSSHAFDSSNLGQRRGVVIYVPPGLAENEHVPVIYVGDGMGPNFAEIAEALARDGRAAPVILVGISPGRPAPNSACAEARCDPRSQEYLIDIPGATPAESRFESHARFVIEEVIPYVEAHFPVLRTREGRATMGSSSGGAWAITMAALHPETFGSAIGLSVGWGPAALTAARLGNSRVFLAAGRLESGRFLERTTQAAELARSAGAEVRLLTFNAGHALSMWEIAFAEALPFLFPPASAR